MAHIFDAIFGLPHAAQQRIIDGMADRLVFDFIHDAVRRGNGNARFAFALQGPFGIALRSAKPNDVGYDQGEINRTEAKRDQLAVEIARLEREALQP